MGMGIREYGRHKGVSGQAVSKALATGRIQKEPDGTIDPVKADVLWDQNTNPAYQDGKAVTGKTVDPKVVAGKTVISTPVSDQAPTPGSPTYQQYRTALLAINVQKAKIELDITRERFVNADDLEKKLFAVHSMVKERMEGLPRLLAPFLVNQTDEVVIENLLRNAVRSILEAFSYDK